MPSSTVRFRRHFLTWERPWLPQVAEWLAGEWRGEGPLDLSRVLAVVPTRQAGRRLREALAEFAARMHDAAVFAPVARTPDSVLADAANGPDVASRLESLLAWTRVLRTVDLAEVPDVFPVAPPRRDLPWAWRLAESFFRLQTQLTEAGLDFAAVPARVGTGFPEAERWHQLAMLERRQVRELRGVGRRESHAARREFAHAPAVPAGIERIVVLAAPDPLPLAVEVLARWSEQVPVDVVVFAPATEAGAFDHVGRPLAGVWERRELHVPQFDQRVHLCADPAVEAECGAAAARAYGPDADGLIAFGLADPEVLPVLENELSRAGVPSYNPEGRLHRTEGLHALLVALGNVTREPSCDAIAALARCPDFLACLAARFGPSYSVARFLADIDDARTRYLPADLEALRAHASPTLLPALALFDELRDALTSAPFPQNASAALQIVFRGRQFNLARTEDARAKAAADDWRQVMQLCADAAGAFPEIRPAEWWEIGVRLFGDMRRTEEKPSGALELQGWLELPWEDAPHLVVSGLNDGLVPDAVVGDPFLPESLREQLGLKTNAARFARDAYLLQAIAASREHGGRLDLLLAKTSAAGDPLRPSRLLLRCAEAELPQRVAFLFRAAEATRPNLPWTRAWKLRPRREAAPMRVPVTGLRAWLACPFRFYLRHVLRMEAVDAGKSELDARDFGTLCHAALEAMAREPSLRDCSDEPMLRAFLLAAFEREARRRYGENLTLPLVVQLESARQRLAKAAAIQARERAEGWVIERVEWSFSLAIAGVEVRGKIDRIDRHEGTGAWRVLDYKTADTAVAPERAHLRPARPGDERLPPWMRLELEGRHFVWADLQLPIYLRALAAEAPAGSSVTCGYLNLPKASGETAISLWPELTPELRAAADACAEGVGAAIGAGEFWPPAEVPAERDAFASLFHHGAADSVEFSTATARVEVAAP